MIESREDPVKPEADSADAIPVGSMRDPLSPVESAFARELFERYQLSLYRYLTRLLHSREEAQEILQETYLRILRQPNFEHVRINARAYLLRGIESERALFNASGLDSPDWDSWPELALEAEQAGRAIVDVLQELDPPVRSALLLHRFRGLKQQQISAWLGVSERTVERYIKEGLTRIAARLKVGK